MLSQGTIAETPMKEEFCERFYFILLLLVIWKIMPVIYFTQDPFMFLNVKSWHVFIQLLLSLF